MGVAIGGPIVGAFSLTLLVEFLEIPAKAQPLVYAAILILVIFGLRGGLVSLPNQVSAWLRRLQRIVRGTPTHESA